MIAKMMTNSELYERIVEQLKTIYDPEFPLIDIYTMGLIYDITIEGEKDDNKDKKDHSEKRIIVSMTFTSPQCPAIDMLQQMVTFAVTRNFPEYAFELKIVRDPVRTIHMIQDEDFKKMFE